MYPKLKRWMYRDNRPNWLAQILNRFWRVIHSSPIASNQWVTLEVVGRKSGRKIALPVVVAYLDGKRYLVSMLGENASWVLNVRAAGGKAVIQSGRRINVYLEEVPTTQRPPILKNYLQRAPGARPHIPVDKDAPVSAFDSVAANFPVFRIVPEDRT